VGSNHCFAHAQKPSCKSFGADALCSNAGSLKEQVQFVSQHFGVAQAGILAQPHEVRAVRPLEFFDHPPGWVILVTCRADVNSQMFSLKSISDVSFILEDALAAFMIRTHYTIWSTYRASAR
jgi:hypothetical protein